MRRPRATAVTAIHHDELEIPEGLSLRRSLRPPQTVGAVLGENDDAELGLGHVGYGADRDWLVSSLERAIRSI